MGSSSSFYQETNPTPSALLTANAILAQGLADASTAAAGAATVTSLLSTISTTFSGAMLAFIATLPTTDPHASGQPWWNGESFSISQG
jgi:hypothetical protein